MQNWRQAFRSWPVSSTEAVDDDEGYAWDGEDAIVTEADGAAAQRQTALYILQPAPHQPVNISCIPAQRLANAIVLTILVPQFLKSESGEGDQLHMS